MTRKSNFKACEIILQINKAGEGKELPVFQTDGWSLHGNSVSRQFEIRALGHRGNNTKVQRRLWSGAL